MKKAKRIALVVCTFLLVILLTGCGKTPVDAEKFKSVMEGKGLQALDYSTYAQSEGAESAVFANDKEGKISGGYLKYESVDRAKTEYESEVKEVEKNKVSGSINTSVSVGNYDKYTLTYSGKYSVVERVEDTIVFLVADEDQKSVVENILKELGY